MYHRSRRQFLKELLSSNVLSHLKREYSGAWDITKTGSVWVPETYMCLQSLCLFGNMCKDLKVILYSQINRKSP